MLENNIIEQKTTDSIYTTYKQQFKVYNKKYRETHQDKIRAIRQSDTYKKSKREFLERNPDYYNNYYYNHKEKILERQRNAKTFCEVCNKHISSSHFNQHSKRQIHIDNLNKLEILKSRCHEN